MLDLRLWPVGLQKKCVQLRGTSNATESSYDLCLITSYLCMLARLLPFTLCMLMYVCEIGVCVYVTLMSVC